MPAKSTKGLITAAVTLTGRSDPSLILTKHFIQIYTIFHFWQPFCDRNATASLISSEKYVDITTLTKSIHGYRSKTALLYFVISECLTIESIRQLY